MRRSGRSSRAALDIMNDGRQFVWAYAAALYLVRRSRRPVL